MPQCFVTNCGNYYGKTRGNSKIIYHMFPSSADLALKWSEVCRGEKILPPAYSRVCSDHFSASCYQRDLQHELLGLPLRRRLRPDAVPDMKIPGVKKTVPMRSSLRIAERESIELVRKKENHEDDVHMKNLGNDGSTMRCIYKKELKGAVSSNVNHGKDIQGKTLGEELVNKINNYGDDVQVKALVEECFKKAYGQNLGKNSFKYGVNCKNYGNGAHKKNVRDVIRGEFFQKNCSTVVVGKDNVCNSMGKVEFLAGLRLRLKCKNKGEICDSIKVPLRVYEFQCTVANTSGSIYR